MSHQFFHEITIACEMESVFDYVTDPHCWHEWFSSSLPSIVDGDAADAGESFAVHSHHRPIRHAPFKFTVTLDCQVTKCDRPYLWELEAHSDLVDAIASYTLSREADATVLKRQFRYHPKGWLRYAEPLLFRRRVAEQAQESLERLKRQIESRCDPPPSQSRRQASHSPPV